MLTSAFFEKILIFKHFLIISSIDVFLNCNSKSQLSDVDGSQNVVNLFFYHQKKQLKAYFAEVSSFLKVRHFYKFLMN